MATYMVVGSDGAHYQIEGPDNADPSDVIKQVTGAHKFGTGKSLDAIGNGQTAPTGSPLAKAAQSPVSDTNGLQNFAAGYGMAGHNLAQGVGQTLGLVSRQDVADSRALDAPLSQTTGGRIGNIAGTVANLAPAAFIPGANTMAGAGAIGAGLGSLQPSISTGETLRNTGIGAVAGPVGLGVGRAIGVGYNAVKSTLQPFFDSGQDAIASRALQRFAGGPQGAADAMASVNAPRSILPGVQPTTAELANNAGLAQLERQLGNNPDAMNALTQRTQSNRIAMNNAIGSIAGTPADMQAAVAARSAVSKPLYDAAAQTQIPVDPALASLMQRPSMQAAAGRATTLAAERGDTLGMPGAAVNPNAYSTNPVTQTIFDGKNIQYLKMALNDMANSGPQMGMGSHEVGAVKGTLGSLNDWTTANVPALRQADAAYANASKPINQMQVGQQLSDKLRPALSDFDPNLARTNANAYATAVRGGDAIAADVTGNQSATLAKTMSPEQMQTIQQVGEQLARRANATDLGRSAGSNTSQNIVSQNILHQVLGPMGLPESWGQGLANSTLMQSILRPAQFIGKAGEGKVLDKLSNAALNPVEANRLLQMNIDPSVAKAIWARQGMFGTLGTSSALLGNSAQQ